MASENENRETLADVVAIVRRAAQYYECEAEKSEGLLRESFKLSAANYREIADRIEAAWKRDEERAVEHATRHAEAVARDNCRDCVHNPNGKNYEGVGNAAATREALELFVEYSELVCKMGMFNRDRLIAITTKARAALSAPPRNCDRKFVDKVDMYYAFKDWCHAKGHTMEPLLASDAFDWFLETAMEKGAADDK